MVCLTSLKTITITHIVDIDREDEDINQIDVETEPGHSSDGHHGDSRIDEDFDTLDGGGLSADTEDLHDDANIEGMQIADTTDSSSSTDSADCGMGLNDHIVEDVNANFESEVSDAEKFARRNTTEFHPVLTGAVNSRNFSLLIVVF